MSRVKDTWRFTLHKVDDEDSLLGFSYSYLTGIHNVTIYKPDDPTRPCNLLLVESDIPLLKSLVASLEKHNHES